MKKDNVVLSKSYAFSVRIVNLYKYLSSKKVDITIVRQLLKSGTSIGVNIEEAEGGHSKKEFYQKMTIAYKEARETHYWIRLLRDTEYLSEEESDSLLNDCNELLNSLEVYKKLLKRH